MLSTRNNADPVWSAEHTAVVHEIISRLSADAQLALPDFTKRFTLSVSQNSYGYAAVLSQDDGSDRLAVRFVSNTWEDTQEKYSEPERWLYAVVWCVRKLREYLLYNKFTLEIPDHVTASLVTS